MKLEGFLNIPFGSDRDKVAFEMGKRNAKYDKYNSHDERHRYDDFEFTGRDVYEADFYFLDNKLCRVKIIFRDNYHSPYILAEEYEQIKNEINSKYFVSDNDYIKYNPPAYENDDFENTHIMNIERQLIEYATFWNFESDSDYDNYIILKMSKDLRRVILYEDGNLYKKYLEKKKNEW